MTTLSWPIGSNSKRPIFLSPLPLPERTLAACTRADGLQPAPFMIIEAAALPAEDVKGVDAAHSWWRAMLEAGRQTGCRSASPASSTRW